MKNNVIYRRKPSVSADNGGEDGNVRIVKAQNHWSQRALRKIGLKIPAQTYRELDSYGSFVFRQIDGEKTVSEILSALTDAFPDADHLSERLALYLAHLENEEKWIEKI
ncbi:MAG: PqqD family protein [Streptococcaceae bacterium]|jgi:hypothetical protein|nr:PqqD family protein [Streptococcaceae bacterium]